MKARPLAAGGQLGSSKRAIGSNVRALGPLRCEPTASALARPAHATRFFGPADPSLCLSVRFARPVRSGPISSPVGAQATSCCWPLTTTNPAAHSTRWQQ